VDAKEELKRALKAYRGGILLISHEPDFYREVATQVWNCEGWSTKII
jgi:ATPase subunit of ABC transporter with duplicated ATPase domains